MPATSLRMRASIRSRISGFSVRTVPAISAVSAMTLVASPAWNLVTETTADSTGSTERETMVCSAWTMRRADDDRIDGAVRAGGVAADGR